MKLIRTIASGFLLVISVAMTVGGCAMSNIQVRQLETGVQAGPKSNVPVPVYEQGISTPPRAVMRFALLTAVGNGYSNNESLKRDMAARGAQLGADCVLVGTAESFQAGNVYSFSGGMGWGSPVYATAMQGVACMWSPVRMGVAHEEDGKIKDVVPGSSAARAGIRIGDRILSINGVRVTNDPFAFERAIARMQPGKSYPIELVASDNSTRTVQLVADANN